MQRAWKVLDYLEKFLCVLVVLIMSVMTISTFLQIIGRYLFTIPLPWTEELSRRLMTWLLFVASAVAYRKGGMMGIDILTTLFPANLKTIIGIVMNLLIAAFGAFMISQGYLMAVKSARQISSALGISMRTVYMIIPVSGALFILFAAEAIIKQAISLKDTKRGAGA